MLLKFRDRQFFNCRFSVPVDKHLYTPSRETIECGSFTVLKLEVSNFVLINLFDYRKYQIFYLDLLV